jgi:hypothetical protein
LRENQNLLHFLVRRLLPARIAKLLRFHPLGVLLLVLRRRVIAVFAIPALQRNDFSHFSKPFQLRKPVVDKSNPNYSMISVTAPAPTV